MGMGELREEQQELWATALEANAAIRSIIHKHTGEGWTEYPEGLAKEDEVEDPSDEDLRHYERKRKDKPERYQADHPANCPRITGRRGKALQRKRNEKPEHTFAHVYVT